MKGVDEVFAKLDQPTRHVVSSGAHSAKQSAVFNLLKATKLPSTDPWPGCPICDARPAKIDIHCELMR